MSATFAALAVASGVAAGVAAQDAAARGFETILWVRGREDAAAGFFAAVKKAGFTAVSVTSGQDPTLPRKHGLRFYRDQICGKGVLELRSNQFQPVREAYAKHRKAQALHRPTCLSSTATLMKLAKVLSGQLGAALPHGPIAVSLGDEVSVTKHANPLDFCFAPATLKVFRAFLRSRYLEIEKLNESWGTDFATFDRVTPFTADTIRQREFDSRMLPRNLAPWAAHREFMDREFARVVRRLVEQVGRASSSLPVGLTGIQQPSAYGGHDYSLLLPNLSFFEVYDIGGARDLAMSLAPTRSLQVATLFPLQPEEPQGFVSARLADMVAHGMGAAVVWSSAEVFGPDRALTRYGKAIVDATELLTPAADAFAGATLRRSPVWLVESQASVRAWWMLDSRLDGATWIKRLSSFEAKHSTSLAARHGWIRMLEDLGLQPWLVPATQLADRLAKNPPRLLVLPATIAMADKTARVITDYVAKGGVLVADHTPALYDERLHLRDKAALDELFGVHGRSDELRKLLVHQGQPLQAARLDTGAAAAESDLRGELTDPVSGFHVQMERQHGQGLSFYLNLAVCEYGAVRLAPKRLPIALDLRKRVRFILRQAKVRPPVAVRGKRVPTCFERMLLESTDGRRLLAIRLNVLESEAVLRELMKRKLIGLRLTFPRPVKLRNLLTGETHPSGMHVDVGMDPRVGLFFVVAKPD